MPAYVAFHINESISEQATLMLFTVRIGHSSLDLESVLVLLPASYSILRTSGTSLVSRYSNQQNDAGVGLGQSSVGNRLGQ